MTEEIGGKLIEQIRAEMRAEIEATVKDIGKRAEIIINSLNDRINKIKEAIYNYLEAGSSIALSSVKANLRSI